MNIRKFIAKFFSKKMRSGLKPMHCKECGANNFRMWATLKIECDARYYRALPNQPLNKFSRPAAYWDETVFTCNECGATHED